MKIRLLNAGLFAFALSMMLSGCSSDETLTGDSNAAVKSMKINVSDGLFTSVDNGVKTRATDTETTTTFSSGDAIGIFVVKSDGTLTLTNAKYTYDGTSWLNSDSTDYLPFYEGAKYFAYYPYQPSLSSDKYDATKTTAETFFASLISGWTPAADQSTQANYTAQDLMVSMATVDASTHVSSFPMHHQMSIVEMDFHQVYYTYQGTGAYRFRCDEPRTPFNIADGKSRLLVKPSDSLSVTGSNRYNSTDATKTKGWKIDGTAPAAAKYKVYKYNGASACLIDCGRPCVYIGDANIGDYLYADGTSGTTFKSGKTVGIIFSSELTQAQYDAGCRHGKALALKDAYSLSCQWSNGSTSPYVKPIYVRTLPQIFNEISSGYDALSADSSYVGNINNPAWYYCKTYSDGTTHSGSLVGRNWYLPSEGEWWDILENLCTWTAAEKATILGMRTRDGSDTMSGLSVSYFSNLDSKLRAASGTVLNHTSAYYWSASELNASNAVMIAFFDSLVNLFGDSKTSKHRVRAVIAY